jgi:hypothetical protein
MLWVAENLNAACAQKISGFPSSGSEADSRNAELPRCFRVVWRVAQGYGVFRSSSAFLRAAANMSGSGFEC